MIAGTSGVAGRGLTSSACTPGLGAGMTSGVGVCLCVGVGVGAGVCVCVGMGVGAGVCVCVGMGVGVGVCVGMGVGAGVCVCVGVCTGTTSTLRAASGIGMTRGKTAAAFGFVSPLSAFVSGQ
ncbi:MULTISPECIES: hypothetical protein [Pseudomonas]|uniref:hypothetical protein n=1 Tax=Pseudomonas TaxID=286 RepID=UPI001E4DAF81|nr:MULTISPECIES: hypothetical protein [Pseudomonas]MCT8964933.1 hypothetical protein [Pseudomonas veronii]UHG96243.1 hypothetical protein LQ249_21500 [Pseudomonas sp. 7-41]